MGYIDKIRIDWFILPQSVVISANILLLGIKITIIIRTKTQTNLLQTILLISVD